MADRPIFEVADELIRNVTAGKFGKAFKSVRLTDVEDADKETPTALVIVAVGDHAALLSRAYTAATADQESPLIECGKPTDRRIFRAPRGDFVVEWTGWPERAEPPRPCSLQAGHEGLCAA